MPWVNNNAPAAPGVSASIQDGGTSIRWQPGSGTAKIAVQAKIGGTWRTMKISPVSSQSITIPRADAIAREAKDSPYVNLLVVRQADQLNLGGLARTLNDLRIPPANRLEKLTGERAGQYSIRINDQWRICFIWNNGDAQDVQIVDYH